MTPRAKTLDQIHSNPDLQHYKERVSAESKQSPVSLILALGATYTLNELGK